jgi:hypothetical protein
MLTLLMMYNLKQGPYHAVARAVSIISGFSLQMMILTKTDSSAPWVENGDTIAISLRISYQSGTRERDRTIVVSRLRILASFVESTLESLALPLS